MVPGPRDGPPISQSQARNEPCGCSSGGAPEDLPRARCPSSGYKLQCRSGRLGLLHLRPITNIPSDRDAAVPTTTLRGISRMRETIEFFSNFVVPKVVLHLENLLKGARLCGIEIEQLARLQFGATPAQHSHAALSKSCSSSCQANTAHAAGSSTFGQLSARILAPRERVEPSPLKIVWSSVGELSRVQPTSEKVPDSTPFKALPNNQEQGDQQRARKGPTKRKNHNFTCASAASGDSGGSAAVLGEHPFDWNRVRHKAIEGIIGCHRTVDAPGATQAWRPPTSANHSPPLSQEWELSTLGSSDPAA